MDDQWTSVHQAEEELLEDADCAEMDEHWNERCAEAAAAIPPENQPSEPMAGVRNWRELVDWRAVVSS